MSDDGAVEVTLASFRSEVLGKRFVGHLVELDQSFVGGLHGLYAVLGGQVQASSQIDDSA